VYGLLAAVLLRGVALAQDADSPHYMRTATGEADSERCGACHDADMTLSRSKVETCTLCHSATLHAGAAEHLRAPAARVQARLGGRKAFPLAEDGRMYCGTCHLFHDPVIFEEQPLPRPHLPPATGLAGAVRRTRESEWAAVAERHEETTAGAGFATKGVRALRLPVGELCGRCHRYDK
jgi:hypothetical protein